MDFLLNLHGHNRWLIAGVWLVGTAILLAGQRYAQSTRLRQLAMLAAGTLFGLMTLQLLLGGILFFWKWQSTGTIPRYRWEHVLTMLLVLLGLHFPLRWRHIPLPSWWRRMLWLYLVAGLFLYLGVSRLPKGWLG